MPPRRALLAAPLALLAGAVRAETPPGEVALSDTSALAMHKIGLAADNPDLILRWNALPAEGPLDIVMHYHGFADGPASALDLREMMTDSGLDLASPHQGGAARGRATLALLPRGRPRATERRPGAMDFPAITAPGGLVALLDAGLAGLAAATGRTSAEHGRLLLTAHSGGGAGLLETLDQAAREGIRIDQVHCYDALYRDPAPLIRWARATANCVLVVLYVPGGRNEVTAREVAAALSWARVEPSMAGHAGMPRAHGGRLLADATAPLP